MNTDNNITEPYGPMVGEVVKKISSANINSILLQDLDHVIKMMRERNFVVSIAIDLEVSKIEAALRNIRILLTKEVGL